jgi:urea transport system substrate-binding protein
VRLDGENLHTWLWPKIAQAKSNGQFEIIVESKEWLRPDPYAAYPNQVCTGKGLVEKKA